MLAANSQLNVGTSLLAKLHRGADQLTHARHINGCEWIFGDDFQVGIFRQETSGVVTAHAQTCLREIIGAEREKLRGLRDLVSGKRATRNFNHGSNHVLQLLLGRGHDFFGHAVRELDLNFKFLGETNKWNHDLWSNLDAFGLHLRRRLKDGAHLHFADLGIDSSQAATAETKHGVELVQFMHARGNLLHGHAKFARKRLLRCGIIGQKFMQWRIKQANARGRAIERAEMPSKSPR